MAENIASGIVERMQRLGVDGVDFMQAEGCGIRNMRCDDQTSTHLYLLELIREKMPKGINIFCVFISPFVQFTVFLRYVKSNEFLRDLSTQAVVQLPISNVHRIVNSVAMDIASYSHTYIAYPTVEEQNITAARILEKYGFPGCPSVMDGSQVKIRY